MKFFSIIIFFFSVFTISSQEKKPFIKRIKIGPSISYEYSQYNLTKQYYYRLDINSNEIVKSKERNQDLTYPKFGIGLSLSISNKFELNSGYNISFSTFDYVIGNFKITQHNIPLLLDYKQQVKNDNIFFKPKLGISILARKVETVGKANTTYRKGMYCTSIGVSGSGSNGIGISPSGGGNSCNSSLIHLSNIVTTISNTNSYKWLPVLTTGFSIQLMRERIEFGMLGNFYVKNFNLIKATISETFFSSGETKQLNHEMQTQPYSANIFFIWYPNWSKNNTN